MKHITQVPFSCHEASKTETSLAVKLILLGAIIISLLILGYGKITDENDQTHVRINIPEPDGMASELEKSDVTGKYSTDILISLLADPSPAIRWQAVYRLSETDDPRLVVPLITLIDDPEPDVRYRVVKTLGTYNDQRVVDPLLYCLSEDDKVIRIEAIRSLGNFTDKRALRMLCLLTLDEDADIRLEAVRALGAIKDSSSIETLTDALDDESLNVKGEAAQALFSITGEFYEVDMFEEDHF
ncbi:hypothetical protein GF359_08085 [candidate division WOR-3 bacterium]|uniref:HEAT repeat domain-containing protein n=1 Tax=candidate division WOR-3 bacterium TaxID=2052148 RepID=A0A9D5QD17_UNCW3|nr:hypothetical protein [candidate division WOR-3 bacterium]MBD3365159.1 hypothetical protein [candidate division WOR-3 bacterium]